jgi:hypothetical protein
MDGFWITSSTIEVAAKDILRGKLLVPQDQCLHHLYCAVYGDSTLGNMLMKNIIEYTLIVSSQPKTFLLRVQIVTKLEARVHLIFSRFR